MKNRKRFAILLAIVFIISISSIFAETNSTNQTSLELRFLICANETRIMMQEMNESGFNTIRINDTLNSATDAYLVQKTLKDRRKKYDFAAALSTCEEIKEIKKQAVESSYELEALIKYYNMSLTKDMNTTEIDIIIEEIKNEKSSERYEKIPALIEKAYTEISRTVSSYTALNSFYKNTTRNLKLFLEKNWKWLGFLVLVLGILFFAYRFRIRKWNIEKKLNALDIRKRTIKSLIMNLQKNYFQGGDVSESEYNIKTKKLAELIRDIDRQIPLLQEEMMKVEKKMADKEKTISKNNKEYKEDEAETREAVKEKKKSPNRKKLKIVKKRKNKK